MLAQRRYPVPADPNFYQDRFYVHDRLGSVRLVVDYNDLDGYVSVANSYTYTPFGSHYDGEAPAETVENPFKFTGQWHDAEINQYYLRARMYDPTMMRFTSRDPVRGKFTEPMTLHKYLYCWNNPANMVDLTGESPTMDVLGGMFIGSMLGATQGAFGGLLFATMDNLRTVMDGGDIDWDQIMTLTLKGAYVGALSGAISGGIGGPIAPFENFMRNMYGSCGAGVTGGFFWKDIKKAFGSIAGTSQINNARQMGILGVIHDWGLD